MEIQKIKKIRKISVVVFISSLIIWFGLDIAFKYFVPKIIYTGYDRMTPYFECYERDCLFINESWPLTTILVVNIILFALIVFSLLSIIINTILLLIIRRRIRKI